MYIFFYILDWAGSKAPNQLYRVSHNNVWAKFSVFRMSDFQKPKQSWRKNRKNENRFQPFQRLPLGYTITEYELPTPTGAEDYSCAVARAKIWRNLRFSRESEPFSMGIPLKVVQNPRHLQKIRTSARRSYNLRPQWELEAHIRWLGSPGE